MKNRNEKMEIKDFLNDKENENLLKSKINSKHHRNIISNILNENKNNEGLLKYLINSYSDYQANKNLMKNNKILLEDFFSVSFIDNSDFELTNLRRFELFNDSVQKAIINNKAHKLEKRIISNKYGYLCDLNTKKLFLEMAQMDFTKQELQDFVGKKIGAFRHSEELNGALMNLIEIKGGWKPDIFIQKLKKAGCVENIDFEIRHNEDKKLMIDINTFKASEAIGSKMWCISRENRMFEYYKEKKYTEYSFYYNFNTNPSYDLSMLAILKNVDERVSSLYTKGDEEIYIDKEYENINNEIKNLLKTKKRLHSVTDKLSKIYKYNKKYNISCFNEENKYSLSNTFGLNDLFSLSSDSWFQTITKEEMLNNPNVYDIEGELKDHRLVDVVDLKSIFSNKFKKPHFQIKNFLEYNSVEPEKAQEILFHKDVKKDFIKNQIPSYVSYLENNYRFDLIAGLLEDKDVINSAITKFKVDLSFNNKKNILEVLIQNENIYKHFEKENKLNVINDFMLNLKNEIKTHNDLIPEKDWLGETLEYTNEEDHFILFLSQCKNKKNYENLLKIEPKIKDFYFDIYKIDKPEQYEKEELFRSIFQLDSEVYNHFNFKNNEDIVITSLFNKLEDTYISKSYALHVNDKDLYFDKNNEDKSIRLLNKLKETKFDFQEVIKERALKTLCNLSFLNLGNEESADKRGVELFSNIFKNVNLEPICVKSIFENEAEKAAKNKVRMQNDSHIVKGYKYVINKLEESNLIHFDNVNDFYDMNYAIDQNKGELCYIADFLIEKSYYNFKNKKTFKNK